PAKRPTILNSRPGRQSSICKACNAGWARGRYFRWGAKIPAYSLLLSLRYNAWRKPRKIEFFRKPPEDDAMMRCAILMLANVLVVTCAALADDKPAGDTEKPIPSQDELDKQFSETMSGATLIGNFTVSGIKSDQPLKEDRYTLGEVKKLKNGYWS